MRKVIFLAFCLPLILLSIACSADSSTLKNTLSNTGKKLVLEPTSLDVSNKISLSFNVSSGSKIDAIVTMNVYKDGKIVGSKTENVSTGTLKNITMTAENLKVKASDPLTVKLIVQDDNKKTISSASLDVKNSLVQLGKDSVKCVVEKMTNEEKAALVTGYNILSEHPSKVAGAAGATYTIERFGIPSITLADGPAGIRIDPKGSTRCGIAYPSTTNLANSWNRDLVKEVGASIGRDTAAYGVDVILGPGMNIQRNVLNGRNFEYFSEDPYVTGNMGAAYVSGVQSAGTGTSVKHFAVNNQETSRGMVSANVTERALREIYLRGFEIAVTKASPWTVMTTYNKLNGIYNSVNKDLDTGILRDEWGYTGFVMTDWDAGGDIVQMVKAQNDISMPGKDKFRSTILEAINNKTITTEEINRSCENILRAVVKSKTFSNKKYSNSPDFKNGAALSRKAAAEGMVLLKNNGALPVKKGNIAVFGNAQVHTVTSGFGAGDVNTKYKVSIIQGLSNCSEFTINQTLKNKYRSCRANDIGIDKDENPKNDLQELAITDAKAQQAAKESTDAVIVISRTTREGKDHTAGAGDFQLNQKETDLIDRVSKAFHNAGKKVTVVINTGNPIEVASWRDKVDAILYAGLAGQETGNAVADIISGKVNPSGKLAATFPMKYQDSPSSKSFPGNAYNAFYTEDIYVGYRYYQTFDVKPAYAFGYGLSYTNFEYSNYKISDNIFKDKLTVSVDVKNTGNTAGKEIVQLYVTKPEVKLEQPKYILTAFEKTKTLSPGKTQTIEMTIDKDTLKSYDTSDSNWVIEAGDYVLSIGASVADIKKTFNFSVPSEIIVQDVENRCAPDTQFDVMTKESGAEAASEGESLALSKPAKADVHEGNYIESNANDGDMTTRWSAFVETTEPNHWWQVDLGKAYDLGKIKIYWESINTTYNIEVAENKNGPWKTVVSNGEPGNLNSEFDLKGEHGRYIRINIGLNAWASIYEFEVYEAKR